MPERDSITVVVSGYDNLEWIGRGAFANVYRGRQLAVRRVVALKILIAAGLAGTDIERFQRECETMAALGYHAHIVQIYDAGTTDIGLPYIAMEYMAGGTVADLMASDRRLPWNEAVDIGAAVASALAAAHDEGVLHRDVKPANILLSRSGTPKLSDFGIAQVAGATTTRGAFRGTVAYAAPEAFDGEQTALSDIYSLGATIYALIAGHPPFADSNEVSFNQLLKRITLDPVEVSNLDVPDDLRDVLERCLAKEPEDRFASAHELAFAFERLQVRPAAAPAPIPPVPVSVPPVPVSVPPVPDTRPEPARPPIPPSPPRPASPLARVGIVCACLTYAGAVAHTIALLPVLGDAQSPWDFPPGRWQLGIPVAMMLISATLSLVPSTRRFGLSIIAGLITYSLPAAVLEIDLLAHLSGPHWLYALIVGLVALNIACVIAIVAITRTSRFTFLGAHTPLFVGSAVLTLVVVVSSAFTYITHAPLGLSEADFFGVPSQRFPSYVVLVVVTLGIPMVAALLTDHGARTGLMIGWFTAWGAGLAYRFSSADYYGSYGNPTAAAIVLAVAFSAMIVLWLTVGKRREAAPVDSEDVAPAIQ